MDKLYLRGVVDGLRPVLSEFDKQCVARGIKYTILVDEPSRQKFEISTEDRDLIRVLRVFAAKYTVVVENAGRTLDFAYGQPHVDDSTYGLDLIDDDVKFRIGEAVISYLGSRHGSVIRENMQGLAVPIKKLNTETLWQTHSNHPRYSELGEDKSCYVGVISSFPPLVVDTLDEGAPVKHAGVLVDGFKRLYASYYRQEPQVNAIDIADVVSGIQGRLGLHIEGYKLPKGKYSKTVDECYKGEVGKLKGDLLAHDNKTVVPKGSVVKVVDDDAGLPDIKVNGTIVNVDRESLEKVWKPASFSQQLDAALVEGKEIAEAPVEKSELENKLSTVFGTISIVEPEILLTIKPGLK